MNQVLLTLALLAHQDCSCEPAEARRVVAAARTAADRHGVPQDLLLAIVLHESRCTRPVVPIAGGCDVGYAQVHLEACEPAAVRALLRPTVNLDRAAVVLTWSRRACTTKLKRTWRCRQTTWARYNWHDSRWWPRVSRRLLLLRRTYRRLHAAHQHLLW